MALGRERESESETEIILTESSESGVLGIHIFLGMNIYLLKSRIRKLNKEQALSLPLKSEKEGFSTRRTGEEQRLIFVFTAGAG
ncbi:hypothetical protein JZ751_029349 [Albula glossodonta]|uniref:Uncharacterized protein n=1 Tax=Albula glossodonta TaxID=121402 RepID=A0A8T2PCV3_9TELE|nr:hypothetical protein JZ751_029349 [Albula glossodonta]